MSSILNRLALPLDWAWRALTRNSQRKSAQGREREGKRCYQPWREITSVAEKKESEYAFATETRWMRKRPTKSRSGRAGKITEEMMSGQMWKLQHVERPEEVGELYNERKVGQKSQGIMKTFLQEVRGLVKSKSARGKYHLSKEHIAELYIPSPPPQFFPSASISRPSQPRERNFFFSRYSYSWWSDPVMEVDIRRARTELKFALGADHNAKLSRSQPQSAAVSRIWSNKKKKKTPDWLVELLLACNPVLKITASSAGSHTHRQLEMWFILR